MPSKNEPNESESQPPDLFSSVETRAMLEEFRELVRAGILRVTPENEILPVKQPPGEAGSEKQPQASASREEEVALLDKQLREWLERRREPKGEEGRRPLKPPGQAGEAVPPGIRHKVIERVAQKLVESWDRLDRTADPRESLREQIVERTADDLVRRLEPNLE